MWLLLTKFKNQGVKRTQQIYSLCRLGHSAVHEISSHKTSEPSSSDVSMQTGAKGSKFQAGHMLARHCSQSNEFTKRFSREAWTPHGDIASKSELVHGWSVSSDVSSHTGTPPISPALLYGIAFTRRRDEQQLSHDCLTIIQHFLGSTPPSPILYWVNHSLSMAWQQKHHCSI